jgi:hypothetical protein
VTTYNLDNDTNVTEEIMLPMIITTEFRKNPSYSRDYVLIANSVGLVFIPMIVLVSDRKFSVSVSVSVQI